MHIFTQIFRNGHLLATLYLLPSRVTHRSQPCNISAAQPAPVTPLPISCCCCIGVCVVGQITLSSWIWFALGPKNIEFIIDGQLGRRDHPPCKLKFQIVICSFACTIIAPRADRTTAADFFPSISLFLPDLGNFPHSDVVVGKIKIILSYI